MTAKPPEWALGPHDDIEPGVEVRPNDDGTIDEVVIHFPGGLLHVEQMDDDRYWMALDWTEVDGTKRHQAIWLHRHKKRIFPTVNR